MTTLIDVLEDQEARTQIRTAFDSSLFVEAGAGTGKTTELVHRVVGLIEAGRAQLIEIVAITFTEAAAGELRERVRGKLESRLLEASGEAAKNLSAAIDQIEDAPMQTIHGFANRLLQMNPTAVGLPPVFDVRDGTAASLAFDAQWRAIARRLFVAKDGEQSPHTRLLHMAWMLGADMRKLRAMARAFNEEAHRLDVVAPSDTSFAWLHSVDELVTLADSIVAFQFHCSKEDDTLAVMLRNDICPWHDRLVVALKRDDEFAVIELLRNGFNKPKGSAKNWPSDVLEQVREGCERLEAKREEVLEVPRRWVMQGLVALVADLAKESEQRRIREGTLEFGDLLVLADRLAQREDILREIQSRYRYLFVDEFQDTDPLQARLVQNLVTPVDGGEERLFTVGDPKQSIYRFRNADLNQYMAVRAKYEEFVTELTTNFRTLPAILSWVDSVFEPLMTNSLGSWSPLGHGRAGEHAGSVQVFGDVAAEGVLSAHVREIETVELAQRLVAARDQGWLVHDHAGGMRAIRYGDMAVLLPTRRSLANLERAFRHAGIPYRVESRSLIWSTQEIRDVVSILRVLDDAQNENAVIASLRSPAFGCGDDELAAWRAEGGSWNPLGESIVPGHPVADGLLALRALRERARFMDVPAIVDMVIEERGLFHSAFGHLRQREPWNRLRFLIDQAQAWFDNGDSGLHAFLQWVDENEEQNASTVESVVPESDDDAVRVMTIHAAKGLEFPLAAVIGLGSVPSSADSVRVLWSIDGKQPEVRIGSAVEGWQTAGFASAADRDAEAESAERLRLLYVAVTRARDHLLVGLHRTAKERRPYSLASLLATAVADVEACDTPECVVQADPAVATVAAAGSIDDAERSIREASERRAAVLASATRNVQFSATKIAQLVSNVDSVLPVRTAGKFENTGDLSYRLTLGSAVHKALEIVAFDASAEELEQVAALVSVEFGLVGYEPSIVEAAAKALRSSPVLEAAALGRHWREVSVAKEIEGVIVRGTIDLLYERDGGLVVVDYKTEAVPTEAIVQEAVDRYRYQLYSYATALQQEGLGRVIEAVLLFIPPGAGEATVVTLPAEEAGSALRQVLATGV